MRIKKKKKNWKCAQEPSGESCSSSNDGRGKKREPRERRWRKKQSEGGSREDGGVPGISTLSLMSEGRMLRMSVSAAGGPQRSGAPEETKAILIGHWITVWLFHRENRAALTSDPKGQWCARTFMLHRFYQEPRSATFSSPCIYESAEEKHSKLLWEENSLVLVGQY